MHDEKNYRYITRDSVIELMPKENSVMAVLIKNRNTLTTYDELCNAIYGRKADARLIKIISTVVSRLRWKLEGEIVIKNRNNLGYHLQYKIERKENDIR